jgi:hypothetical protein
MSKPKNAPQGMSLTTKVAIIVLSLAVAGGVTALGVHLARTHPPRSPAIQSGRFPVGAEAGFLHQCEKSGSATLCGCVLHELEARFTFDQFRNLAETFSKTKALPSGAVDALSKCTHSLSPSPTGT